MDDLLHQLFRWGGVGVCTAVVVVCAWRATLISRSRTRLSWRTSYWLMACFAMGVGLDLAARGLMVAFLDHPLIWCVAGGVASIAAHLLATWRLWANGQPPAESNRVPLGPQ